MNFFFAFSSKYFSVVDARDEKLGQNQIFAGKNWGYVILGPKFLSFIADLLLNIFGKTWNSLKNSAFYSKLFSVIFRVNLTKKVWKNWGYKPDF